MFLLFKPQSIEEARRNREKFRVQKLLYLPGRISLWPLLLSVISVVNEKHQTIKKNNAEQLLQI